MKRLTVLEPRRYYIIESLGPQKAYDPFLAQSTKIGIPPAFRGLWRWKALDPVMLISTLFQSPRLAFLNRTRLSASPADNFRLRPRVDGL